MIKIVYWSGTGNTENMANHIAEGIKASGKEVHTTLVGNIEVNEVMDAEVIVLGCPAMGAEQLEEDEMQPFVDALLPQIEGKKVALFGSYGWGTGEWMEIWHEEIKAARANVVCEPLIVNEFTTGQDEEICKQYGERLAKC
ncbi:flavodoxin [Cellulosilyticum ruminicola]|uniref:flavodoxin n=1 Tax=Cellulosilyticum ruminicola TaxID=425254 RepID=UPI0006D1C494|nr:flavodoxin [Cellulosilyticum ruminicola]